MRLFPDLPLDRRRVEKWDKKKLSMDEVKKRFFEAGLEVLSEEYKSAKSPLQVRCYERGHEFLFTVVQINVAKCCVLCRSEDRRN